MLCFDGERVGSPPFESLARQKHCLTMLVRGTLQKKFNAIIDNSDDV